MAFLKTADYSLSKRRIIKLCVKFSFKKSRVERIVSRNGFALLIIFGFII